MGSTTGERRKPKRPATPATRKKAKTRSSMSSEELQRSPSENRYLKWQLQTQQNLSEVRAECMKVRRELVKVGEDTETAIAQIDSSLEELGGLREDVATQVRMVSDTVKTVHADLKQVQETTATAKTDVAKIMSVLTKLAKQMKTNKEASSALAARVTNMLENHKWIDDDYLMEQLTAMQERYESELQKCKTDYRRIFNEKQLAIDGLSQALIKVQTDYTEALRQNNHVAGLREQQVKDLAFQVGDMGRTVQSCSRESFDFRNEVAAMGHHLRSLDGRVADIALRPLPPVPLAASQAPVIDNASQNAMHDKINHMGQDLRLLATDFTRLARRTDESHNDLRQWFTTEMKRLGSEMFAALQHDSHQHIAENKRMRDTIFDLQADMRELRQERIRVEEELRRDVSRNMRSPSPPGYAKHRRRYEPADAGGPPPYRFSDAQPAGPHTNQPPPFLGNERMDRPGANPFWPHDGLLRRSRSRSRSPRPRPPPHRVQIERETDAGRKDAPPLWREDRIGTSYAPPREPTAAPALPADPATETPQPSQPRAELESAQPAAEANQDIRTRLRPRKSRTHDVIVIEEDDESGEESAEAASIPPARVPADDESPPAATDNEPLTIDLLDSIEDIRVGSALYFHFGGAPNLSFEWMTRFDKLKSDDCVDIPRTMKFQQQYQALQMFPIHFTQFVIQSIVVNGVARAKSGKSQNLDKLDANIVRAEYQIAANCIRRSWVEALIDELKSIVAQNLSATDASAMQLSMHPCLAVDGLIVAVENERIVDDWRQKQANALFALAKSRLDISRKYFQEDWQDNFARGSPASYLLVLIFDVERVHMQSQQWADLRLNDVGRALVLKLWTHSLAQLPYLLFVDCSWLEDQSESSGKISSLAFCHVLVSILVWNSLTDVKRIVTPRYYDLVLKSLLKHLHVEGRCQETETMSVNLLNKKSLIELRGVDINFVSVADLDDFYEIARASQAN